MNSITTANCALCLTSQDQRFSLKTRRDGDGKVNAEDVDVSETEVSLESADTMLHYSGALRVREVSSHNTQKESEKWRGYRCNQSKLSPCVEKNESQTQKRDGKTDGRNKLRQNLIYSSDTSQKNPQCPLPPANVQYQYPDETALHPPKHPSRPFARNSQGRALRTKQTSTRGVVRRSSSGKISDRLRNIFYRTKSSDQTLLSMKELSAEFAEEKLRSQRKHEVEPSIGSTTTNQTANYRSKTQGLEIQMPRVGPRRKPLRRENPPVQITTKHDARAHAEKACPMGTRIMTGDGKFQSSRGNSASAFVTSSYFVNSTKNMVDEYFQILEDFDDSCHFRTTGNLDAVAKSSIDEYQKIVEDFDSDRGKRSLPFSYNDV